MSRLLLPALLGLAALAQPASATTYTMTYIGTVSSGSQDITGVFGGGAYSDLSGLAFTAVYTVDDATPGADSYAGKLTPYDNDITYIRGGVGYGTSATPVSATLTINGITQGVVGSAYGIAQRIDGYRPDYTSYDAIDNYVTSATGSLQMFLYAAGANGAPDLVQTADYRGSLDIDISPLTSQTTSFNFYRNDSVYYWAQGGLDIAHLTIAAAAPVPEPGEWAMIALGLGLVGRAARRKDARSHGG